MSAHSSAQIVHIETIEILSCKDEIDEIEGLWLPFFFIFCFANLKSE